MTGVSGELLSGLPDDLARLVADPPVTEKKLLELGATWTGIAASQARMAEALRLFLVTWDPLERAAPRPSGFATVNGGSSDLELVVYVPIWSAVELASSADGTIAAALGALAGSAVVTAAAHEPAVLAGRYPDLVVRGAAPDLLDDRAAGASLGAAQWRLGSPGWEDIGLGAITDVVQQAYGPVDLDRSPVELSAGSEPGCPACASQRFGFPADLAEAQEEMCSAHRGEAGRVIAARLERAEASNPDGWGALADASGRLSLPHLPGGLATELAGAEMAMYETPAPNELAVRPARGRGCRLVRRPPGRVRDRARRRPGMGPASFPTGSPTWSSISGGPGSPRRRRWSATRWCGWTRASRPLSTATSRWRLPRPAWRSRRAPGSGPTSPAGQMTSGSGSTPVTRSSHSGTATGRSRTSRSRGAWPRTRTTSKPSPM
jgi:hypothetical protein